MRWDLWRERFARILGAIRAGTTRRRVAITMLAAIGVIVFAVACEALIRARLEPMALRAVTTLYTRPEPWDRDDQVDPVPIGTVTGAPVEERIPVEVDQVPAVLVQAVLAVEDQRFYAHHGIDVRRLVGAMIANLRAGRIVQGGSTLTQQLAKNLYLSSSRTPMRKLREAAMALVLEMRYDKRTILQAYLNEIYLGQDGNRALHGVGAAAHYYLGKDVRRLSLAESALLAAMISAPNRNSALRHPEAARARRDMVLRLMLDQHRASANAVARAQATDVAVRVHPATALDGRYFRAWAAERLPPHTPTRGAVVYTTLDASLQRAAERAVADGLNRFRTEHAEASLVAIDPRTGDVLAMVGGRDYGASQFNRATEARRQPGSAFKPIVAIAALDRHGADEPPFTLASILEDEPLRVETAHGPWEPVDYDETFRGPVTLREAMEESLNVPFARVGLAVGPDRIVAAARRVGIESRLNAVPSLALGSSEVTLLEMVRAYGVLADSGMLVATRAVLAVGKPGQAMQVDSGPMPVRAVDPAVAYLVTSMLEGVVTRGTGRALNADGRFGSIAGKTGTSNDWRDAWFIAYSPELVVGAWVGFDDDRTLRMTGAAAALPMVAAFLAQATPPDGWPEFERPAGVTESFVAAEDGDGVDCGTRELFLDGTQPSGADRCQTFDTRVLRGTGDWGAALERRAAEWVERMLARLQANALRRQGH